MLQNIGYELQLTSKVKKIEDNKNAHSRYKFGSNYNQIISEHKEMPA